MKPADIKKALQKHGLESLDKPKLTPSHPAKRAKVLVKNGDSLKLVRFGDAKMTTAGKPKGTDTKEDKARRASFKVRHAKNIARGKTSGAYWANKLFW